MSDPIGQFIKQVPFSEVFENHSIIQKIRMMKEYRELRDVAENTRPGKKSHKLCTIRAIEDLDRVYSGREWYTGRPMLSSYNLAPWVKPTSYVETGGGRVGWNGGSSYREFQDQVFEKLDKLNGETFRI